MNISPLAIVHPDAQLGEGVRIDPFVTIEADVEIGSDTWIRSQAYINSGTKIGDNCNIYQGAIIGGDSQDKKYQGGHARLEIGNDVTIREYCTINRSSSKEGITSIGDHSLLMAYVHVAHDSMLEEHTIIANAVNIAGHVRIGAYATVGGMTAVQQFVIIGRYSYVGGGTLIRKDVPPYVKAAREPIAYVGVNKVGLQRGGFKAIQIAQMQDIYRHLFVHSKNISQAMSDIKERFSDNPYCEEIIAFVEASPNGVIRGYRSEE